MCDDGRTLVSLHALCVLSWRGSQASTLTSHWRVDGGPTSLAGLQKVASYGGWESVSQVRAVTPLTVLLCLGSCSIYLSHKRIVRLQSWLGFNALIGSTGEVKRILGVLRKPSRLIAL